ncbi:MAG: glucuronate isomerase [Planctomycetales bacterium]
MTFIHDDFLLGTKTARHLYHTFAAPQPILDYHCHLPPGDVSRNRQFKDLFEIWLEGDHYKWRAMRANGVGEHLCTGDADPYDKFLAWSSTVPHTLRNPLYHWTHLELKRYFDIDTLLDETTARSVWDRTADKLASDDLSTHGILKKFDVRAVCTTDDPVDDLASHKAIAVSNLGTAVYPTFRPDKALEVHQPDAFNQWTDSLSEASDVHIASLADFQQALASRHQFFHDCGGRLSDHGLSRCHADFCDENTCSAIFQKVRGGTAADPLEHRQFASNMMLFFGRLDAEKGWTKQLHLGAMRNNNQRLFKQLGPDIGCDSIGDYPQGEALSRLLSRLDEEHALPRTILYNLNPADNYLFGTMIGNFQDGRLAGKMQFGSGWWHLDQKEGMELQINALSNLGLLSRFIGMLTDSRSFLSYPRHEYFRRCLCNLLGRDIENGEIPDDEALVGQMIKNICFHNAREFLGLKLTATADSK